MYLLVFPVLKVVVVDLIKEAAVLEVVMEDMVHLQYLMDKHKDNLFLLE